MTKSIVLIFGLVAPVLQTMYLVVAYACYLITKGDSLIVQSFKSENKDTPLNCLHNCVSYFLRICKDFPRFSIEFSGGPVAGQYLKI